MLSCLVCTLQQNIGDNSREYEIIMKGYIPRKFEDSVVQILHPKEIHHPLYKANTAPASMLATTLARPAIRGVDAPNEGAAALAAADVL